MKTLSQIQANYKSQTLDGRDLSRLSQFIPEADLAGFGLSLHPEFVGKHQAKEFTEAAVIDQLRNDVEFGFEKALNKRGISSSLMFEVVKMWNWILEDGLDASADNNYEQYGLPHFKAVAVKYGFENPIGDDDGDEYKYSSEADYE